jgi:hypothetical protein
MTTLTTGMMSPIHFFPEGGVGLVPERRCLLTLAYYAFSRWYEFGERRWNDILTGENRRTRRKSCPSATLPTPNPTWIDPGANPGLSGERPATDDLSHGTSFCSLNIHFWVWIILRSWSPCALTSCEVVRDCGKFGKHWHKGECCKTKPTLLTKNNPTAISNWLIFGTKMTSVTCIFPWNLILTTAVTKAMLHWLFD